VALVESIVPGYNGSSGFERWARVCIRRKLIDQQRADRNPDMIFTQFREGWGFIPELVRDRERPNYDLKFLELTAELSDQQAAILWLTHYRGMTVSEVADLLKINRRCICSRIREAIAALRDKLGSRPVDKSPA
jgi:RNA polymerase sigma factor (sigma-70 family)